MLIYSFKMKISAEQIKQIDIALGKMGVAYMDIRCELTDHIANELEAKEGDFDTELSIYLKQNKKHIRRTNRKMFFLSSAGAYKELVKTLIKPVFIVGFLMLAITMLLLNNYVGHENVMQFSFLVFCCVSSYISFAMLFRMFYRRRSYSGSIGFSLVVLVLLYLSIFVMGWDGATKYSMVTGVYFAFVIVTTIAMLITSEKQYSIYKLRYS